MQVVDESELAQQRLMLSILAACAGPDCQIYDGEEQEGELANSFNSEEAVQ